MNPNKYSTWSILPQRAKIPYIFGQGIQMLLNRLIFGAQLLTLSGRSLLQTAISGGLCEGFPVSPSRRDSNESNERTLRSLEPPDPSSSASQGVLEDFGRHHLHQGAHIPPTNDSFHQTSIWPAWMSYNPHSLAYLKHLEKHVSFELRFICLQRSPTEKLRWITHKTRQKPPRFNHPKTRVCPSPKPIHDAKEKSKGHESLIFCKILSSRICSRLSALDFFPKMEFTPSSWRTSRRRFLYQS